MSEPQEPKQSCPRLDAALAAIKDVTNTLKGASHYNSVEDFADQIDRDLWNIEDDIESARKINEELREWGQWYKDRYVAEEAIDE